MIVFDIENSYESHKRNIKNIYPATRAETWHKTNFELLDEILARNIPFIREELETETWSNLWRHGAASYWSSSIPPARQCTKFPTASCKQKAALDNYKKKHRPEKQQTPNKCMCSHPDQNVELKVTDGAYIWHLAFNRAPKGNIRTTSTRGIFPVLGNHWYTQTPQFISLSPAVNWQ